MVALAAALLAASLAAAASAQVPDTPTVPDPPPSTVPGDATAPGGPLDQNLDQPGSVGDEEGAGAASTDTDLTPQAKDSDAWKQIAGAIYPFDTGDEGTELVDGSVTSFADDLFTVSFQSVDRGFAGGSTCLDPPDRADFATPEEYGLEVKGCTRGPVIYQYADPLDGDAEWKRAVIRGAGEEGYVGAIAWISNTKAVAVGGGGEYPRREAGRDPAESYEDWLAKDVAGQGRAWIYDPARTGDQTWREINLDEQNSPCAQPTDQRCGMRGMTALDFKQGVDPELGFAGALGQLWEWESEPGGASGTFAKRIDRGSPQSEMTGAQSFDYRVRAVRFVPGEEAARAYAVTAGCCSDNPAELTPRVLEYVQDGTPAPWLLSVPVIPEPVSDVPPQEIKVSKTDIGPIKLSPIHGRDLGVQEQPVRDLGVEETTVIDKTPVVTDEIPIYEYDPPAISLGEHGKAVNRISAASAAAGRATPDSYYSLSVSDSSDLSLVASPGGPERDGEQSSMVTACGNAASWQFTRLNLSTARLHSADGDTNAAYFAMTTDGYPESGRPSTGGGCGASFGGGGDGLPDWAMGELRSTRRPGLGARALAYTTIGPGLQPETLNIHKGFSEEPQTGWDHQPQIMDNPTGYQLTSKEKLDEYRKSLYFLLPSYTLNSLEMVSETGVGWTVGDHGAILGIGGDGVRGGGGAEPPPPKLPSRPGAEVPGAAYAGQGPPVPSGGPGPVPALAAQRTESLGRPELVPTGFADPTHVAPGEGVRQIVMSRDGSEGWALGPPRPWSSEERATLFHFSGGTWTRCDPVGVSGLLPPDTACASLAHLLDWRDKDKARHQSSLIAAARVPVENDSDPSNDDEFEVIAIGTLYAATPSSPQRPVIARYRDGRWQVEDDASREAVIASGSMGGVAFTAPDDGWIVGPPGGSANNFKLFHFDGERWGDCPAQGGCDDPDGRTVFKVTSNADLTSYTRGTVEDEVKGIVSVGDRVYLYGTRAGPDGKPYPMIIWHERGSPGWHGSSDGSDGSYDPGFDANRDRIADGADAGGTVDSLALTQDSSGEYLGWAVGSFDGSAGISTLQGQKLAVPATSVARLEASGEWEAYPDTGALHDYLIPSLQGRSRWGTSQRIQAILPPDGGGDGHALIGQERTGRIFEFDPATGRWGLLRDAGRLMNLYGEIQGDVRAIAPDGQGGAWVAIHNNQGGNVGTNPLLAFGHDYFFHYTDHTPAAVFTEAPNPFDESSARLTSLQGAPDGTLWAGATDGTLYRYDRLTGWARTHVPGWDPGRVVTRRTGINGVAVGASGVGIAVGDGGRIADLSPREVKLDPAAGTTLCSASQGGPCSTGRDLHVAAVAPDGSAIAGGESMALLWRSGAGGDFRTIPGPAAGAGTSITGVSMPTPDRAYLATDSGSVYAGRLDGSVWSWRLEDLGPQGQILTEDFPNHPLPLSAIAVGPPPASHGYAVGPGGVILERSGSGERPWRRLDTPYLDELTSVTLDGGGGTGLIGGASGLILTASGDRVEVARPADYFGERGSGGSLDLMFPPRPPTPVVGLALLPGVEAGQTEAWAGLTGHSSGDGTDRLLHYASAPEEPLLDPSGRTTPLGDSPPPRPGEISLAAFGKSECNVIASDLGRDVCLENQGTTQLNEVIMRRIEDEIAADAPGAPELAIYTGDAVDTAGQLAQPLNAASAQPISVASASGSAEPERHGYPDRRDVGGPLKHRRFAELFAQPLVDAGVPLLGAVGGQDLSELSKCIDVIGTGCPGTKSAGPEAGDNLAWRQAFASMPAPWGGGDQTAGDVVVEPVEGSGAGSVRATDVAALEDPTGAGLDTGARLDGASTHYAADVSRSGSETPIARVVVLDSSLGSPAGSDPTQQPVEIQGQLDWLDRMTCFSGTGAGCSREPGQPAIVVSNAPTYSYGPGALTETDTGGSVLDQRLVENSVNLLVSGKLGWNGLYYIRGLGELPPLHHPDPGDPYPEAPPEPLPGGDDPIPAVVASSAGGKFNPEAVRAGNATAPDGFWRGYTKVRLDPQGDYRDTVVEQRPILDWVRVLGKTHTLRAGRSMTLEGVGREPFGVAYTGARGGYSVGLYAIAAHDEISTAAITHRYELLEADPDRPWLPKEDQGSADDATEVRSAASQRLGESDPCGGYLCLDPSIGTVNDQSGAVRAGKGTYPRTYAIAQLSVGDEVATYPLVFEPRASYKTPPAPVVPPVAVPPPASPPAPAQPTTPSVNLPAAPVLPVLTAQALAPPPLPPAPPTFASEAPLDLNLSPAALDVTPPTAVSQPPTPPVNPAPPSGARREARQRQAAAQKSGADSDASEQAEDATGDLADNPNATGTAMTRHEFTAIAHREQPSAWARNALLGGGLGIAALILALGATGRPTPRAREPRIPAPAWARGRHRR